MSSRSSRSIGVSDIDTHLSERQTPRRRLSISEVDSVLCHGAFFHEIFGQAELIEEFQGPTPEGRSSTVDGHRRLVVSLDNEGRACELAQLHGHQQADGTTSHDERVHLFGAHFAVVDPGRK